MTEKTRYDDISSLCLKRAIFYPSSEIYGSLSGFFDYGSVGTKMKNNWENYWRFYFLKSLNENFVEIQGNNITHSKIWKASGHLDHFEDPIVQCKKCKNIERADQILEKELKKEFEGLSPKELDEIIRKNKIKCSQCKGELSEVGVLNLMFGFETGSFENKTSVYLRPETAQLPYVNFKREFIANREQLPLGLAVIGRAYRNEISPRQMFFRMREFSQAECQIFFDADKVNEHENFDEVKDYKIRVVLAGERDKEEQLLKASEIVKKGYPKFCVYYMAKVQQFYDSLKIPVEKLRFFEKNEKERAFYNKLHFDVEIFFEMFDKYMEVSGFHYRGNHDLTGHEKVSNEKLSVVKEGKRILPHILELSFGVDRNLFALIDLNFKKQGERTFISLPEKIVPYKAGIYPLMKKDGLGEKADKIYKSINNTDIFYDDSGSIGKRYARADEIGVLYGITIDHQTLEDDTVTVRERDSMKQERVKIKEIEKYLI